MAVISFHQQDDSMVLSNLEHAGPWREALAQPPRWLPLLAAVAVALILAVAIAGLVTAAHYQPVGRAETAPVTSDTYADQVAAASWFGRADAPAGDADLPLTESGLALTLRAVFVTGGGEAASAIVETADGRTEVVRAGSEITAGAVLEEVSADHIVVRTNGRREQLHFPASADRPVVARAEQTTAGRDAVAGGRATGDLSNEEKRANILRRLEELRARGAG